MAYTMEWKNAHWLNGLKNKIYLFAAYKKLTSQKYTQTEKERQNIPCLQKGKIRRYNYSTTRKRDFNTKIINRDKSGSHKMIKGLIQQKVTKVRVCALNDTWLYKRINNGYEWIHRLPCNNSGGLQHHSVINRCIN